MTPLLKLATTLIAAFLFTGPPASAHADKGMLRIVTEPGDAQIFINGKRKGNSPAEAGQSFAIKLDEGEYRVQVIKPESETNEYYGEKQVFLADDSLQTVNFDLNTRLTEKGKAQENERKAEDAKRKEEKERQVKMQVTQALASIEQSMVAIAAGSFTMGSPSSEPQRDSDEGPQHNVTMQAFEMSKYETTFDEWDACVADGGCDHWPDDQGWGRGKRPVIDITIGDIRQYLVWLNKKTSKRYRLPSEAEWEYAARAGTNTSYSWGDYIGSDRANCRNRANCDGCQKAWDVERTLPVGSFAANPWGLYDMHGNVWEWTQDCWSDDYRGSPTDGSAWISGDCGRLVVRGGSWTSTPKSLRAAARNYIEVGNRKNGSGFRVARSR